MCSAITSLAKSAFAWYFTPIKLFNLSDVFVVKLRFHFISDRLNNFIGVKYHVKADFPNDVIALHNFEDGYCGISQIEDGKHCICYLTKASNLKKAGTIEKMEAEILSENPHLKKLFGSVTKLYNTPVTISQISFSKKQCVENNVLMLGDAGGMITPLCGNGMSIDRKSVV